LPKGVLIVLINRADEIIVPTGSVVLQQNDIVLVLADRDSLEHLRRAIDGVSNPTAPPAT
jgi:Trk K+ transport system NAD-binding subunit